MTDFELFYLLDEVYVYRIFSNISENKKQIGSLFYILSECPDGISNFLISENFYQYSENGVDAATVYYDYANNEHRDDLLRLQAELNRIAPDEIPSLCGYLDNYRNPAAVITSNQRANEIACWDEANFTKVDNKLSLIKNLRDMLIYHQASEEFFWFLSHNAFPELYFHTPERPLRFSDLGFPYRDTLEWCVNVFSYLNDKDLRQLITTPNDFIADAGACDVEISPESPKTHKNKKAMKEREIHIDGRSVLCEWHAKYRFDKGRIHFHHGNNLEEEINTKTKGKTVIGIFCQHLTT